MENPFRSPRSKSVFQFSLDENDNSFANVNKKTTKKSPNKKNDNLPAPIMSPFRPLISVFIPQTKKEVKNTNINTNKTINNKNKIEEKTQTQTIQNTPKKSIFIPPNNTNKPVVKSTVKEEATKAILPSKDINKTKTNEATNTAKNEVNSLPKKSPKKKKDRIQSKPARKGTNQFFFQHKKKTNNDMIIDDNNNNDEKEPHAYFYKLIDDLESEYKIAENHSHIVLSDNLLQKIHIEIIKLNRKKNLLFIPLEKLQFLISILMTHIKSHCSLQFNFGMIKEKDTDQRINSSIISTFKSIIIIQNILISDSPVNPAFMEETIAYLIDVIHTHFVYLFNTQNLEVKIVVDGEEIQNSDDSEGENLIVCDNDIKELKKKRKKEIDRTHRIIFLLINHLSEIFELFYHILKIVKVSDNLVLRLLHNSFLLLFFNYQTCKVSGSKFTSKNFTDLLNNSKFIKKNQIENNLIDLQLKSINIIQVIHSNYIEQRKFIFQEIYQFFFYQLPNYFALTSSRKIFRKYGLNYGRDIQMVSALIMRLIQCSTQSSTIQLFEKLNIKDEFYDDDDVISRQKILCKKQSQCIKSYGDTVNFVKEFLLVLTQKCIQSSNQTSDLRLILENLIEDFLVCLYQPEWPAAELIITTQCSIFVSALFTKSFLDKDQTLDHSFKILSIKMIGNITTKLRKQILISNRFPSFLSPDKQINNKEEEEEESPSSDKMSDSEDDSENEENSIIEENKEEGGGIEEVNIDEVGACLKCNEKCNDRFMLDCDRCHQWFHGECVNVDPLAPLPELWFCDLCTLYMRLEDDCKLISEIVNKEDNENGDEDEDKSNLLDGKKKEKKNYHYSYRKVKLCEENIPRVVLSQLLLYFLKHSSYDPSFDSAKSFELCQILFYNNKLFHQRMIEKEEFLQEEEEEVEEVAEEGDDDSDGGFKQNRIIKKNKEKKKEGIDSSRLNEVNEFILTNLFQTHSQNLSVTRDSIISMILEFARERELYTSFNNLLSIILFYLNDKSIATRSNSIKLLSNLIDVDPSLLLNEKILKAIKDRRMDTSISVRQSVIELIGNYILTDERLLDRYLPLIVDRINDTGITVRKKVVKILTKICLQYKEMANQNVKNICMKLINRINDNDQSIRMMVIETFRKLWFFYEDDQRMSKKMRSEMQKKFIDNQIVQMIAVFQYYSHLAASSNGANSNSNYNYDWFLHLLNSVIASKEEKKFSMEDHFQLLVDSLIQKMIEFEEKNIQKNESDSEEEEEEEELNFDKEEDEEKSTKSLANILSCITILNLFCKINPSLLIAHVNILHPYLRILASYSRPNLQSNSSPRFSRYQLRDQMIKNNVEFLCQIIEILQHVIPLMEDPPSSLLTSVEEDLSVLIQTHFAMKVVQQSVHCLSVVVMTSTRHYAIIQKLYLHFVQYLEKNIVQLKSNLQFRGSEEEMRRVMRYLFIIGAFCRYFEFNKIQRKLQISINEKVFEIYSFYANLQQNPNIATQIKAMQGLGHLWIAFPKIILRSQNLISSHLESPINAIRLQTVCNFIELLNEEKKLNGFDVYYLQSKNQKEEKKSSSNNNNEDNNNNNEDQNENSVIENNIHILFPTKQSKYYLEIAAQMIQKNIQTILKFTLNLDTQLRFAAFTVLESMIQLGISHPSVSIEYLIALLSDKTSHLLYEKTLRLLQYIDSKFPTLIINRLPDGIKFAYLFQKRRYKTSNSLTIYSSNLLNNNNNNNNENDVKNDKKNNKNNKDDDNEDNINNGNNNLQLESIFGGLYSIIGSSEKDKEKITKKKQFIDVFIKLLENSTNENFFLESSNLLNFNGIHSIQNNNQNNQIEINNDEKKEKEGTRGYFIKFICDTLSFLPYKCAFEALHVIYWSDRIRELQGNLLPSLKPLYRSLSAHSKKKKASLTSSQCGLFIL